MPRTAVFPAGRIVSRVKFETTVSVRRLSKNVKNILCNSHGECYSDLAQFSAYAATPGLGGFEIYLCEPCVEKLLKRKMP